jgi:hypothetical protein
MVEIPPIVSLCEKIQRAIEARCVGLVEITQTSSAAETIHFYNDQYIDLGYSINSQVSFIHRTAYDFLNDTEDGHSIRMYDSSAQDEQSL